jgi:hypothetical protein
MRILPPFLISRLCLNKIDNTQAELEMKKKSFCLVQENIPQLLYEKDQSSLFSIFLTIRWTSIPIGTNKSVTASLNSI